MGAAIHCAASLLARSLLRNSLDTLPTAVLQRCTAGALRYRPAIGSKRDVIFHHQRSDFSSFHEKPPILSATSPVTRLIVPDRIEPHPTAAPQQRLVDGFWDQSAIVSERDLGFYPQRPHLSELPATPTSNDELVELLGSCILSAEDDASHVGFYREYTIPVGYPFEIQDDDGKTIVTLRSKYQDENIEVIVGMSSRDTDKYGVYCDCDNSCDCDSMDSSRIPLTVRVKKGERNPSLEFICTNYRGDLTIDAMSLKRDSSDRRMLAYEGPDFNDLDENLQKAFREYLEVRGISVFMTAFFDLYMDNKPALGYVQWLRSLKQFVEK